jgi:hypothetical protein
MKFPSRWEQPGDAHAVLHRRPAAGLPALCCPSPPVHTAWEETPPTPSPPAMPTVTYFLGTAVPTSGPSLDSGASASGRT